MVLVCNISAHASTRQRGLPLLRGEVLFQGDPGINGAVQISRSVEFRCQAKAAVIYQGLNGVAEGRVETRKNYRIFIAVAYFEVQRSYKSNSSYENRFPPFSFGNSRLHAVFVPRSAFHHSCCAQ